MPGYTSLTNRATGQQELVATDDLPTALASGKYVAPDAVAVHRDGQDTYTAPDVAQREQTFNPLIDPAAAARQQGHTIRAKANAGALPTAEAFLGGGISGLTGGIVDPFEDAREFHPLASGAGVLAGAIAPAFVGDFESLGGLVGLGRGAEVADDALTAERAASSLSSKMLYRGEAAAGDAGAAERALAKGNAALAAPPVDLGTLDAAGLKTARETELGAIEADRVPQRQQFVQDLTNFRDTTKQDRYIINATTKGAEDAAAREGGAILVDADMKVRRAVDNPLALADKPERALAALQQQQHALEKIYSTKDAAEAAFADAPKAIREELLANKVEGYRFGKGGISPTSPLVDTIVDKLVAERYGAAGARPGNLTALDKIPALLEKNKALQTKLGELAAEPASDRLTAIDAAIAANKTPHEPSLGERVFHAIAPYAGPVGAIAEKAYSGLRAAVGKAGSVASKAAKAFVDTTSAAAKHAPTISARLLGNVAFAPAVAAPVVAAAASSSARAQAKAQAAAGAGPAQASLLATYQQRTNEIRSQTMYDATGTPVMRPEARAAMAQRLAAVRALSPMLGDRMETVAARRLEYLASVIPKLPDYGTMQVGPDRRRSPDLEMRSFARSAAAVEDPHAAFDRAARGRMTPEDAAALRAVYPEMLADFTQQITEHLPTLQRTLPYARRLSLSMLTGVPVDPAMTPVVLNVIQGMYATEPGTGGGVQAPRPQPQFGSVRADKGTLSQQRQSI